MKTASFFLSPGAVLAVVCFGAGGLAQAAGTLTAQQTVKAQISPTCTIALVNGMVFGTLIATSALAVAQADATGSVTTTCPIGTSYTLGMDAGSNYSGGRRMANGSGQYLTYSVYPSAARTTPLGSSVSASFTGNGAAQAFYTYGRVTAQTAGGFGNFTDTLTFTVTY